VAVTPVGGRDGLRRLGAPAGGNPQT
jgi:hypothetical protein